MISDFSTLNTTMISAGQVFTIEPGIYFIDGLLQPLREGKQAGDIQWPVVDASHDLSAEAFGSALMQQAPPNSLIFTHADKDTFAAWYFHTALGQRADVTVIVEPLLVFDWYRINLSASEPRLVVPARPAPSWRQAILAANARPVCDAQYAADQPALNCPGAR